MDQRQHPVGSGFGPKSEPAEVLDDVDLHGVTAVVTGGYSGIGIETTRALAERGATVFVPVRSPEKAEEALSAVEGDVRRSAMDLADLGSVRRFADEVSGAVSHLDLLITNAGVMATPEGRVGPGWETQFGINHMGHFALTTGLLSTLRAAEAPRVVALSSVAHKRNGIRWDDIQFSDGTYDKWVAYAQSKTANALFARHLSPLLEEDGGRAYSVHPGGILTPLQRHLSLEEEVALGWRREDGEINPAVQDLFKSTTQGCSTTLWAATSPQLQGLGGVYCEDTDVAAAVTSDTPRWLGVAPHATNDEAAARLWSLSETLLADA
ncbi:oxidoreductase [Euzebya tangerina]|uniref:oxidoreductase n=1 Tax=Euzebya tangerina TaxID=591198 RepID=UPI000E31B5F8|nr:oxidoreductase [Euzebya tangerina]